MLTAIVGIVAFAGLIALSFYDSMFDPLMLYPFNYYACVSFGAWILVCFITNGIAQFFIRRKNQKLNATTIEINSEIASQIMIQNMVSISSGSQMLSSVNYETLSTTTVEQTLIYNIEVRRKIAHAFSVLFAIVFFVSPFVFNFIYEYAYASISQPLFFPNPIQSEYHSKYHQLSIRGLCSNTSIFSGLFRGTFCPRNSRNFS